MGSLTLKSVKKFQPEKARVHLKYDGLHFDLEFSQYTISAQHNRLTLLCNPRRHGGRKRQGGLAMKLDDMVIIRRNPHHSEAEDIVGTVKGCLPGEGLGGSDLIDVCYKNPMDGKIYTMPFGPGCLDIADEGSVVSLAEYHEALAEHHKALAAELRNLTGSEKKGA